MEAGKSELQERIENYWNGRTSGYSQTVHEELNSFKKVAWQKLISVCVGDRLEVDVLDVGTGPGFFALILAELGYNVTAVDCSEEMLQCARQNLQMAGLRARFLRSEAHVLPFSDASFDLLVTRNLVWTLPDPVAAYREWYRVLRPGGRLLVCDANWYLRLSDAALQAEYERVMSRAAELGYRPHVTAEQEKECEEIARRLPLTYQYRPDWDERVLAECGFGHIMIDRDISDRVYDAVEKVLFATTPMFMICAEK